MPFVLLVARFISFYLRAYFLVPLLFSRKADSKCASSRCFWFREAKTIFQQELGAAYASVKVIARHYLALSSPHRPPPPGQHCLINICYLVDVSSALLLFDAEKGISEQTAVYRSLSWIKWAAKPPGSLRYTLAYKPFSFTTKLEFQSPCGCIYERPRLGERKASRGLHESGKQYVQKHLLSILSDKWIVGPPKCMGGSMCCGCCEHGWFL